MKKAAKLLTCIAFTVATGASAQDVEVTQAPTPLQISEWARQINRDYPFEAKVNNQEGVVSMQIEIGKDGRVSSCEVTRSSGSAILDLAGCRGMKEHARFKPARDAQGRPVTSTTSQAIRYVLPGEKFVPPPLNSAIPLGEDTWRGLVFDKKYNASLRAANVEYVVFQLVIDETGKPSGCGMNITTGVAALDREGCAALLKHARFKPATLSNGDTIPSASWVGHSTD